MVLDFGTRHRHRTSSEWTILSLFRTLCWCSPLPAWSWQLLTSSMPPRHGTSKLQASSPSATSTKVRPFIHGSEHFLRLIYADAPHGFHSMQISNSGLPWNQPGARALLLPLFFSFTHHHVPVSSCGLALPASLGRLFGRSESQRATLSLINRFCSGPQGVFKQCVCVPEVTALEHLARLPAARKDAAVERIS